MANKTKTNKTKTITEVITATPEERILGGQDQVKTVTVVDYTALERRYRVENVLKSRVYELNGYCIGAILGMNNDARQQLKEGAQKVEIKKRNQDNEYEVIYKIEVLK